MKQVCSLYEMQSIVAILTALVSIDDCNCDNSHFNAQLAHLQNRCGIDDGHNAWMFFTEFEQTAIDWVREDYRMAILFDYLQYEKDNG